MYVNFYMEVSHSTKDLFASYKISKFEWWHG